MFNAKIGQISEKLKYSNPSLEISEDLWQSKKRQLNNYVGGPVLLVEIISVRYRPLEPDLVDTSVGNILDRISLII